MDNPVEWSARQTSTHVAMERAIHDPNPEPLTKTDPRDKSSVQPIK